MQGGGSYPKIDYCMEKEGLDKVCKYHHTTGDKVPENPHTQEVRDYT